MPERREDSPPPTREDAAGGAVAAAGGASAPSRANPGLKEGFFFFTAPDSATTGRVETLGGATNGRAEGAGGTEGAPNENPVAVVTGAAAGGPPKLKPLAGAAGTEVEGEEAEDKKLKPVAAGTSTGDFIFIEPNKVSPPPAGALLGAPLGADTELPRVRSGGAAEGVGPKGPGLPTAPPGTVIDVGKL